MIPTFQARFAGCGIADINPLRVLPKRNCPHGGRRAVDSQNFRGNLMYIILDVVMLSFLFSFFIHQNKAGALWAVLFQRRPPRKLFPIAGFRYIGGAFTAFEVHLCVHRKEKMARRFFTLRLSFMTSKAVKVPPISVFLAILPSKEEKGKVFVFFAKDGKRKAATFSGNGSSRSRGAGNQKNPPIWQCELSAQQFVHCV